MYEAANFRCRVLFPPDSEPSEIPNWLCSFQLVDWVKRATVHTGDIEYKRGFESVADAHAYARSILSVQDSINISVSRQGAMVSECSIGIGREKYRNPSLSLRLERWRLELGVTELARKALVTTEPQNLPSCLFFLPNEGFGQKHDKRQLEPPVTAPPTIPYHHDIPTTGFCQIFSPSFIAGCFCNRIYLDNVECWRRDVIETPDGEALAYWAYDPDELAATEWVETEAQYRARMEMGATIRSGAMVRDPDEEYDGPRLWKRRSGVVDADKRFWVTRNILPSDKKQHIVNAEANDYGVILRAGYVPGGEPGGLNPDGSKPIEHVAVLFSRKESAEISVERLSKRGVETWYVDPASEAGRTQLPVPDGIVGW